jgi:hypothetical protein
MVSGLEAHMADSGTVALPIFKRDLQ